MAKERGLGRGLESLIPAHVRADPENPPQPSETTSVAIGQIKPNPYQPRLTFKDENLQELAESIKSQGIIQPLIVTPQNGHFELVAGERRLRAAKLAGLTEIPVVVRQVTDKEKFVIALVENLQREDLNPIEEATAYKRLIEEFNLTQEELAKMVGKGRVVIANTLRLLNLPQHIQDAVADGSISAGHARNLVSIGDPRFQEEIVERVQSESLTVRQVEKIVSDWKEAIESGQVSVSSRKDPAVRELEENLQRILGTKVEITARGKAGAVRGQVKISFFSLDDLERLTKLLQK